MLETETLLVLFGYVSNIQLSSVYLLQNSYYCDKCDFGTYAEILFTRHCETKKHNE